MYAKTNEFLKEHRRHSPKGPSDLSELERNSKLLQSFQSDISGQPPEGTDLHQPALPAEGFMVDLGPHTKTHAINDSRKDSNAKYCAAAISMASITSLVAILNRLLGFIVESRQGSVEIWAASIIIEADRTDIKNEKEEGEKRRKNEGANAKRILGLSEAIGKVAERVSDAAKREKNQ
ncbi:hypothetical protein AOL_s00006g497 [Orbilia oligospora ATCC 24927]|uniref:Uncharacterized protein n=1 Tax=Arthrobotrys oligospora (strain ATCC 24927 / CBS 115.81 / DSM 1491) TaxID=756982 RepID=G1X0U6_ARTOA|nr:hypothetical protein AOL_s00006g497 [Orbilia oligospora ATCC 24927]EGX53236.1 hypothetical protein AOL_s00006g497 [Orbilia oligospora ATCC 24927]